MRLPPPWLTSPVAFQEQQARYGRLEVQAPAAEFARQPFVIQGRVVNTLNNRPIRLINEDAPIIREAIV